MAEHPHATPGGFPGSHYPWAYHHRYSYWYRRGPGFGRRLFWFGLGVGTAVIWHRCHERKAAELARLGYPMHPGAVGASPEYKSSADMEPARHHVIPAAWTGEHARRWERPASESQRTFVAPMAPSFTTTAPETPAPSALQATPPNQTVPSNWDEERLTEYRRLATDAFSDLTESSLDKMISLLNGLKTNLKSGEIAARTNSPSVATHSAPTPNEKFV